MLLLIDYIYSVVVDNLDKRDAYTTSRFKQNAVSHDNPICCVVQQTKYIYKKNNWNKLMRFDDVVGCFLTF